MILDQHGNPMGSSPLIVPATPRQVCALGLGMGMGLGSKQAAAGGSGGSLESWTWAGDGSDLTDLGGSGGDITTKFSSGKLGVTPSPLHGVFTKLLPASGKFDLTLKFTHTSANSTHFIGNLSFLSNMNARRIGAYSASEQNTADGDQACTLTLNSGKYFSTAMSGSLLDLVRMSWDVAGLSNTYPIVSSYAGTTQGDGSEHTIVLHVDASGATPQASVDFDASEVISSQDMLAGNFSYGSYLAIYIEGSSSGTTPITGCTINEISWQEVA